MGLDNTIEGECYETIDIRKLRRQPRPWRIGDKGSPEQEDRETDWTVVVIIRQLPGVLRRRFQSRLLVPANGATRT